MSTKKKKSPEGEDMKGQYCQQGTKTWKCFPETSQHIFHRSLAAPVRKSVQQDKTHRSPQTSPSVTPDWRTEHLEPYLFLLSVQVPRSLSTYHCPFCSVLTSCPSTSGRGAVYVCLVSQGQICSPAATTDGRRVRKTAAQAVMCPTLQKYRNI